MFSPQAQHVRVAKFDGCCGPPPATAVLTSFPDPPVLGFFALPLGPARGRGEHLCRILQRLRIFQLDPLPTAPFYRIS